MVERVAAVRRVRRDPEDAKRLILRSAERIMLAEGYAAVTIRRIAREIDVNAALLHYYFSTLDDLLVALYRDTSSRELERLQQALNDVEPLKSLWAYLTNRDRTALGVEFAALANHRKRIRIEIVAYCDLTRKLQAEVISKLLASSASNSFNCSPECLTMLLTSVSRNLTAEQAVGLTTGHADVIAFIERFLGELAPSSAQRSHE